MRRPRLPASLQVLRHREYRLLFCANALSLIGSFAVPVALAFAVLEMSGSVKDLGIVLAAGTLPEVVLLLAGGVFADRWRRRTVMVVADLVRMASQGLLAALIISGNATLTNMVVLQVVGSSASAFFSPASTGLLPQLTPREHWHHAVGLRSLSMSLAAIIGPALAGVLVVSIGAGWALAVDALTYGVSALLLLALRPLPAMARTGEAEPSFVRELAEGWREFISRSWLWSIVAQFAVYHMIVVASFQVLGPFLAQRELGGASAWATILAVEGAGALVGSLFALNLRVRHPLVVATLGTFTWIPLMLTLAVAAPVWMIAAAAFLVGFGMPIFGVLWDVTMQHEIPPEALSRVSAYDIVGSIAFLPLGQALMGPVALAIGLRESFLLAAAVSLVSGVLVLLVPGVRQITTPPRALPVEGAAVSTEPR